MAKEYLWQSSDGKVGLLKPSNIVRHERTGRILKVEYAGDFLETEEAWGQSANHSLYFLNGRHLDVDAGRRQSFLGNYLIHPSYNHLNRFFTVRNLNYLFQEYYSFAASFSTNGLSLYNAYNHDGATSPYLEPNDLDHLRGPLECYLMEVKREDDFSYDFGKYWQALGHYFYVPYLRSNWDGRSAFSGYPAVTYPYSYQGYPCPFPQYKVNEKELLPYLNEANYLPKSYSAANLGASPYKIGGVNVLSGIPGFNSSSPGYAYPHIDWQYMELKGGESGSISYYTDEIGAGVTYYGLTLSFEGNWEEAPMVRWEGVYWQGRWEIPHACPYVLVELIGGGGGGGGSSFGVGLGGSTANYRGGGGGGGASVLFLLDCSHIKPDSSCNLSVGIGGTGGDNRIGVSSQGTSGTNGNTTTLEFKNKSNDIIKINAGGGRLGSRSASGMDGISGTGGSLICLKNGTPILTTTISNCRFLRALDGRAGDQPNSVIDSIIGYMYWFANIPGAAEHSLNSIKKTSIDDETPVSPFFQPGFSPVSWGDWGGPSWTQDSKGGAGSYTGNGNAAAQSGQVGGGGGGGSRHTSGGSAGNGGGGRVRVWFAQLGDVVE